VKHPTLLARYCPLWPTSLTGLFLVVTHSSKTHITSQSEHAHIRLSPKSSPADVRYYNPPSLRNLITSSAPSDNHLLELWYQIETPHPTSKILSALAHGLTDLFLVAMHNSKTCLANQDEHAHIRLSFKSSPVDAKYYNRGICMG